MAILMLCSCNKDVENASIQGHVIDKLSHKPLSGIVLFVEAAYYDGGDYDSYNGYHKTKIITNDKGEFEVRFPKIAYIQIKIKKHSNDTLLFDSDITQKNSEFIIRL